MICQKTNRKVTKINPRQNVSKQRIKFSQRKVKKCIRALFTTHTLEESQESPKENYTYAKNP